MAQAGAFDYKAIPAPARGKRTRGARDEPARLAHALAELLNEMATEGWEYLRAERLPCEARKGLWGRETTEVTLLLFRRPRTGAAAVKTEPPLGEAAVLQAAAASLMPSLGPARRGDD